jgi:hypothetical protein
MNRVLKPFYNYDIQTIYTKKRAMKYFETFYHNLQTLIMIQQENQT